MFEFVFVGRARGQYQSFLAEAQAEIDEVIRLLELGPWPDRPAKGNWPCRRRS